MSLWARQNIYKLCYMIFGLTLFPGIIYVVGKLLITTSMTISDFYYYFYGSLLDIGKDGLIVWGIASAPYFFYEVYLLLQAFLARRHLSVRN